MRKPNVLYFFTLLTAGFCDAESPAEFFNLVAYSTGSVFGRSNKSDMPCHLPGEIVCHDCREMGLCMGSSYKNYICPEGTFCTEKKGCSSDKNSCNLLPPIDHQWHCTRDGALPSLTECGTFRLCKNETAYVFQCKEGEYFDPENQACQPDNIGAIGKCQQICSGVLYGKKAYLYNVYTLCIYENPQFVYTCKNWGEVFEEGEANGCIKRCSLPGQKMPVADDPKAFYVCNNDLTKRKLYCSGNMFFDEKYGACQPL